MCPLQSPASLSHQELLAPGLTGGAGPARGCRSRSAAVWQHKMCGSPHSQAGAFRKARTGPALRSALRQGAECSLSVPRPPCTQLNREGDELHHKGTWPTTAPYQGKGPSRRSFLGWKIPNYLSMQLLCQQDLQLKQCWSSLANCAKAQFLFSVTKGEKNPQSTEWHLPSFLR